MADFELLRDYITKLTDIVNQIKAYNETNWIKSSTEILVSLNRN